VEISLSVVEEGDYSRAGDLRDVTDCKHVEAELIVAREYAERARDEADRANLAKSRFLATASHDLRQPLQSLSLLNGTLRRMVTEPDAANHCRIPAPAQAACCTSGWRPDVGGNGALAAHGDGLLRAPKDVEVGDRIEIESLAQAGFHRVAGPSIVSLK
jgi:signal transduction histidine kinase